MIKLKRNSNKKRRIIIASIAIFILVIATGIYLSTSNSWFREHILNIKPGAEQSKNVDTRPTNSVDYSGPSKSDIDASQQGKEKGAAPPSAPADPGSVSVAVSFAGVSNGSVEVRAFIPSIIEGSGQCTATLIKDGEKVEKSNTAFVDASSSQCNPIYIPLSDFPSKGVWSLVVSYKSPDAKGSSEKIEVNL